MALDFMYGFGPESAVVLVQMGFVINATAVVQVEPSQLFLYNYVGDAAPRWSLRLDQGITIKCPVSVNAPQGWAAVPWYMDAGPSSGRAIQVTATVAGTRSSYAQVAASGTIALYVGNVLKETSAVLPLQNNWTYLAMQFDYTANPWQARLYAQGVAITAAQTDPETAETEVSFVFAGIAGGDRNNYLGQIAIWDDTADAGEVPHFVSENTIGVDVSTVGTWVPSVGGTNFGVVGGTFDQATYTEEAAPTTNDDVIVRPVGDLTTELGVNPSTVYGITVITLFNGLGQTGRAEVGDQVGAATTPGATVVATTSPASSFAYATALVKPSGGAWVGTDKPEAKFLVVSA